MTTSIKANLITSTATALVAFASLGSFAGGALAGSIAEPGELGYRLGCSVHEMADTGFRCQEYKDLQSIADGNSSPDYWPEDYDFANPFIHDDLNRIETLNVVPENEAATPSGETADEKVKCTRRQRHNCDALAQVAVQAPYLTGRMVVDALKTATSSPGEILTDLTDPEAKAEKVQKWVDRSEELRDSATRLCLDVLECDAGRATPESIETEDAKLFEDDLVVDFDAHGGLPDDDESIVSAEDDTSIHPAVLEDLNGDDVDFGEEVIDIDSLAEDFVDLEQLAALAAEPEWFEDVDGELQVGEVSEFEENGLADYSNIMSDDLSDYLSTDSAQVDEGEQFASLLAEEDIDFDRPSGAPLDVSGQGAAAGGYAPSSAESFFGFGGRPASDGLSGAAPGRTAALVSYPSPPNASCGALNVQELRTAQCSALSNGVRALDDYLRELDNWQQNSPWKNSPSSGAADRGSVLGSVGLLRQCTQWSRKVNELEYNARCR